MNKILYLGNFNFKNGFAACNRAIGNSCIFRKLGFTTIIYGECLENFANSVFAKDNRIECIEKRKVRGKILNYFSYSQYLKILKQDKEIRAVFLYNFPSIPFIKIVRYCRKFNIRVYADVTEWYSTKNIPLLIKPIKWLDTTIRMKFLHKKCDGLVCISKYLDDYYNNHPNKILVYPLMDYVLWEANTSGYFKAKTDKCVITLAGRDITTKDNLSLFEEFSKLSDIELNIIGCKSKQLKNQISSRNKKINFFVDIPRSAIYNVFSKTSFNYVVRENNRTNNAGFPSKFAESISLGIPVIFSNFSDLGTLSQYYTFGIHKDIFLESYKKDINISPELKNLFLSKTYINQFKKLFDIK